ncbi:MAG: hypothetical protein ABL931_06395 [Usitatibacteraceae bacterium]
MKKIVALLFAVFAAVIFGCKDAKAPKTETRVESASEAARNDDRAIAKRFAEQKAATDTKFEQGRAREERQRTIDAIQALAARWAEGLTETSQTGRSSLAPAIKKLQTIKADAEAVAVDECTGKSRASLVAAMTGAIAAYEAFQKETGDGSSASRQQLEAAEKRLTSSEQELKSCQMT